MAKNKISEFSSTAGDNTDITNINIAEGCSPSNVNNAIRSLMALLKNQQDGSSGDPFTVAGTFNATGGFELDGTAGVSGQALVSAGSGNTPTWSTLGTMSSQNASSVAITGGTITGITDLTVADGGTGASSITANSVILGNGTSTLSGNLVAPGSNGNVLTSNGTTWTSATPSTAVTSLNGETGAITNTDLYAIGSYVIGRPQNNTTTYAVNSTIAGSSLYATPASCLRTSTQWIIAGWGPTSVTLVNVGTWRCVSPAGTDGGSGVGAAGLWVRIS